MKATKTTRHALGLLLLTLTLGSCELETSDNGKLDGLWQQTAIEISGTAARDVRSEGISWAFQGKLLELRLPGNLHDIIFRFNHTGDSLLLSSPYILDREAGDIVLDDMSKLAPFGIDELEPRYHVLQLNGDKMYLESKTVRLSFRKY